MLHMMAQQQQKHVAVNARQVHMMAKQQQKHVIIDRATVEALEKVLFEAPGRNSRAPKRANHGKRPCSHVGRRLRRRVRFGTSKLRGK